MKPSAADDSETELTIRQRAKPDLPRLDRCITEIDELQRASSSVINQDLATRTGICAGDSLPPCETVNQGRGKTIVNTTGPPRHVRCMGLRAAESRSYHYSLHWRPLERGVRMAG